jgi:broad specificity phosphatase PhoE
MRALLVALTLFASAAQADPEWVILVRHAEKASTPADDPDLSEAGRQRAEQLAALLQGAGITHILTSDRRRTQQTAAPLAQRLGLQPQAIATRGGDHIAALLAAVRARQGGALLVVGHSNTVPALLAALGGPRLPDLCEHRYGQLWLLHAASGHLLRLQQGAPDPDPTAGCS